MRNSIRAAIGLCLAASTISAHGLKSEFYEQGGFTTEIPYLDQVHEELMQKYGAPPVPVAKGARRATQIGDRTTFWAMNVAANSPVQVEATLRHVGKHCYIYLELDQEHRVTQQTLETLARRFDEEIYPTNHKFFGTENKPGVDFDERISLLFLDIQDGWEPGKGYVGGYFSPVDQFPTSMWQFSNEREIFYMDINPSDPTSRDYLGILAHEFQHMIHYNYDKKEQLWLNEAMSQISFWVNDFGHAPQILSFLKSADTQIEEFNNGIDDYGNVYLFLYYLATKVIQDREKTALIFKDIVSSPLKGMESIKAALDKHKVATPLEQIVEDFLLANFINDAKVDKGQYAYDSTLPIKVQPTHQIAFASAAGTVIETTVNTNAADFIHFSKKVVSEPLNATLVDKIRIFADKPGKISWNINSGQLPPKVWQPEGSVVTDSHVVMQTTEVNGRHQIEVGPFVRGGVAVTNVNYVIESEHSKINGQIPVYSFQTKAAKSEGTLVLHFNGDHKGLIGKDRKFKLFLLKVDGTGLKTLTSIELDKKNDAIISVPVSELDSFTLIPVATAGGEVKYALNVLTQDSAMLADYLSDTDGFLSSLRQNPSRLSSLTEQLDNLPESMRQRYGKELRGILRQVQFQMFDSAAGEELIREALEDVIGAQKAEDSDTAHDNIQYLVKKAREGVHALSHLKIDPKLVEGQILQIYKLLELIKGFPHLPIPDGFAIKDYRVNQLNTLLDQWVSSGTPAHHETLRRMLVAELAVVKCYDDGLSMAEEASLSLLDLASFFLQAKASVSILMDPLIQGGGIVGHAAEGLKKRIHAKIVQIFGRVVALAAVKLPSPYNTIVPIASAVITTVWTKIFDLTLEEDRKWMKPFAAKTLGKYALMSVPKIGIVDRGQPAVDLIAKHAQSLKTSGTLADAEEDIRIRVYPMEEKIAEISARSKKEREYAQIAKYVTQLAGMTAVIDPTVISKVLGLISAATGTGLLAHSVYESGSYLYSIPGQVPALVDAAFRPFEGDTVVNPDKNEVSSYPKQTQDFTAHRQALAKASENYLAAVGRALQAARSRNLSQGKNIIIITDLEKAEAEYSKVLHQEEMLLLGSQLLDAKQDFMSLSAESLLRSQLEMELLLENASESERVALAVISAEKNRLARLKSGSTDFIPVLAAQLQSVVRNGSEATISIRIQGLGRTKTAELHVHGSDSISIAPYTQKVRSNQTVQLKVTVSTDKSEILFVNLMTAEGNLSMPLLVNL